MKPRVIIAAFVVWFVMVNAVYYVVFLLKLSTVQRFLHIN
jgi:hypothetical protein